MKKDAVIWGAGDCCENVIERLNAIFNIVLVVDKKTEKKALRNMPWIKVSSPQSIKSLKTGFELIIATDNKAVFRDIEQDVMSLKIQYENIGMARDYLDSKISFQNNDLNAYQYVDRLNNRITIDKSVNFKHLEFRFDGGNNHIIIGENVNIINILHGYIGGNNCEFVIGDNTSLVSLWVDMNEGGKIIINEDCMLATDIEMFQSVTHPIFDDIGNRKNYSKNIVIGKHTWIGRKAALMSGFEIGEGSIVGYGAISASKFGNKVIIAGNPARVIRENIQWRRDILSYYPIDSIADSRYPIK